jgi:hypothetical protein
MLCALEAEEGSSNVSYWRVSLSVARRKMVAEYERAISAINAALATII